jgi:hypothetical protein
MVRTAVGATKAPDEAGKGDDRAAGAFVDKDSVDVVGEGDQSIGPADNLG